MTKPIFRSRLAAWTVAAQTMVVIAMLCALGAIIRGDNSRTTMWILYGCMVAETLVTLPLAVSGLKRFDKDS